MWPKMAQIHLNMPKYDPQWPKMAQYGPRMTQNDPKLPKNDPKWPTITPKWPKNDARIYALVPQIFWLKKRFRKLFRF